VNKETKTNLILGFLLGALLVYILYNMGLVFIWGVA